MWEGKSRRLANREKVRFLDRCNRQGGRVMSWILISPIFWMSLPMSEEIERRSAGNLYRQAYQAIGSQELKIAESYLNCLVTFHPGSEHSPAAMLALIELDLIANRIQPAIERLLQNPNQLLLEDLDRDGSESELHKRAKQLLVNALQRLPLEKSHWLRQRLEDSNSPPVVHRTILRELMRLSVRRQQYLEAMDYFEMLGEETTAQERRHFQRAIPLLLLEREPTGLAIERVQRFIADQPTSPPLQRAQLSWLIAEVLCRQNEYSAALSELRSLATFLDELPAPDGDTASLPPPDGDTVPEGDTAAPVPSHGDTASHVGDTAPGGDTARGGDGDWLSSSRLRWRAAVDLRIAELLLLRGDSGQAIELATQALQTYHQDTFQPQFRFLLARGHIADIEFNEAIQQLRKVLIECSEDPELSAQAHWMLGEIRFMQRKYSQAMESYRAVTSIASPSPWHVKAMFQLARCYEIENLPMQASEAYKRILDQGSDPELSRLAEQRLAVLVGGSLGGGRRDSVKPSSGRQTGAPIP
jgi:TolA-binding protein